MSYVTGLPDVSLRALERAPLLLVAGSVDRLTPIAIVEANQRAYRVPAELCVLEGRGHWVLAEQDASEVARLIERFAVPLRDASPRRLALQPLPRSRRLRVAIVGAGPAGLANGAALAQRGVETVIFERATNVGQCWRSHYHRLRLHTTRALSGLAGLPIPRAWGQWVAANDFARYLQRYARHHGLHIVAETTVSGVHREGKIWRVDTDQGSWHADRVILATGLNRTPYLPEWAQQGRFRGVVMHSSEYRDPAAFRGLDVLVVGAGNSGAEIAADLAFGGASRVRIAVRDRSNILPRSLFGVPVQVASVLLGIMPASGLDVLVRCLQRICFGDLTWLGLPRPSRGLFTQITRDQTAPVVDVGLIAAMAEGQVEAVAAVTSIDGDVVKVAHGPAIEPDVVIAATGFRPGLSELLGPALALDERGLPRLSAAAEALDAPGLYFAGYLVSPEGVLRAIARQSEQIADAIANLERSADVEKS
nr:FAD-dependent oxidoreductase [Paraburkholderia sp. BL18I3N2]